MGATVWHENGRTAPIAHDECRQAALGMLEARRAMRGTLPEHLIPDVALELLLSVYLGEDGIVDADAAFDDLAVSVEVARRWLAAVAAEGLLVERGDSIALTEVGRSRMEGMLECVVRSQRRLLGWAAH